MKMFDVGQFNRLFTGGGFDGDVAGTTDDGTQIGHIGTGIFNQ